MLACDRSCSNEDITVVSGTEEPNHGDEPGVPAACLLDEKAH